MTPEVSVIIPSHDRAAFLPIAVDSVLSQKGVDLECIVVDDGSTDHTPSLLASYGGRIRAIRLERNRGPAAARNAGIRAARAEWLAFLDSDDHFLPGKLARQLRALRAQPKFRVCHTQEIWYRRGVLLPQKQRHRKRHGDIFAHCLQLCAISPSTVVVHRSVFDTVGLFAEDIPCCEDYDLWLRVTCRYPVLLVDEPLTVKHGGRPDQVSQRFRVGMDRFRIQSLMRLLLSAPLSAGQHRLARRELARRCLIYGNGCRKHGRPEEADRYLALAEWSQHHATRIRDHRRARPGFPRSGGGGARLTRP